MLELFCIFILTFTAQAQYNMEQKHIEALYEKYYKDVLTDLLSDIFKNKHGLLAVERGKVLGYLSFGRSVNGHFGNVKGSFSPLFANTYSGETRGKIASLLFQYVSEEMINNVHNAIRRDINPKELPFKLGAFHIAYPKETKA